MVLSVNERTFTKEVLESPVPVLVNFWAPWCGLCHLIQPILSEFERHGSKYVKIVSVNADENFRLSNTYRLTTLPTLILIENGIVRRRLDCLHRRDELRQALESIHYDYATSRLKLGARS